MNRPQVVGQPTASEHFQLGLDRFANLLAPTFGPTGGLVAYQRDHGAPEILDNSATIVRRVISLGTPQLDIGAMLMRNVVWRVGQKAGDGGAMAAILAHSLFRESLRRISAGANAMQLVKGIHVATAAAVRSLRQQAQQVSREDELAALAFSIVHDRPLAAVLGELAYLLGPDAHVIIENYVAPYLYRRYINGAYLEGQIASMYLYTEAIKKRAVHNNPAVALVDDRLKTAEQVVPLLDAAMHAGAKSLLIVANDTSDAALSVLVSNHQAKDKKISPLAVKLKAVGDERKWAMADLALLTGATILGESSDRPASKARPEDLGRAARVEVAKGTASKDAVIVLPVKQERAAIQEEITHLRSRLSGLAQDAEDRQMVIKRLAVLAGGVGELRIGALTKSERELLRDSAERALKVLSIAQNQGVAAGGGAALLHCVPALDALRLEDDAQMGVQVMKAVLAAPLRQLLVNAHVPAPGVIMEQVREAGPGTTYDSLQERLVDAAQGGVLDAVGVLETVLRTAVSGAVMAVTTDAIVYHRKPSESLEP